VVARRKGRCSAYICAESRQVSKEADITTLLLSGRQREIQVAGSGSGRRQNRVGSSRRGRQRQKSGVAGSSGARVCEAVRRQCAGSACGSSR